MEHKRPLRSRTSCCCEFILNAVLWRNVLGASYTATHHCRPAMKLRVIRLAALPLSSRPFYDKRISHEVAADTLGEDWKGYIFRISGQLLTGLAKQ